MDPLPCCAMGGTFNKKPTQETRQTSHVGTNDVGRRSLTKIMFVLHKWVPWRVLDVINCFSSNRERNYRKAIIDLDKDIQVLTYQVFCFSTCILHTEDKSVEMF